MMDFEPYLKLKQKYTKWSDVDIPTAFTLSKESNELEVYYGEHLATFEKIKAELKKQAEGVEAEVSVEFDSKNSTQGNRKAKSDMRVKDAWDEFYKTMEVCGKLEAIVRFLGNVHWHTKEVYKQQSTRFAGGR
jgi:hypothetical protein